MITRKEIENTYTVVNGAIRNPGKFEGCPVWAVYFYDLLLDGGADSDDDGVATFRITAEDIAEYPELAGASGVMLREDDSGFIHVACL